MAELAEYRDVVRPQWVDYNGHLSEAYYVLVFGFATDRLMDQVGLDAGYRERTSCSLYTVEAHVRYLHEVHEGAQLLVSSFVLGVSGKTLRLCHEMRDENRLVATEELVALHVRRAKATPFPDYPAHRLKQLVRPEPDYAGRAIRPVS